MQTYIAPKIFGGQEAKSPVGGSGVKLACEAYEFEIKEIRRIGEDILIRSVPKKIQERSVEQMFTGIIEEVGTIKQIQKNPASAVLTIAADTVLEQTKIGDSIAVNGVCLTVTDLKAGSFTADVMHKPCGSLRA